MHVLLPDNGVIRLYRCAPGSVTAQADILELDRDDNAWCAQLVATTAEHGAVVTAHRRAVKLFRHEAPEAADVWTAPEPMRIEALALSDGFLFISGRTPDGARLAMTPLTAGEPDWTEMDLSAEPVESLARAPEFLFALAEHVVGVSALPTGLQLLRLDRPRSDSDGAGGLTTTTLGEMAHPRIVAAAANEKLFAIVTSRTHGGDHLRSLWLVEAQTLSLLRRIDVTWSWPGHAPPHAPRAVELVGEAVLLGTSAGIGIAQDPRELTDFAFAGQAPAGCCEALVVAGECVFAVMEHEELLRWEQIDPDALHAPPS